MTLNQQYTVATIGGAILALGVAAYLIVAEINRPATFAERWQPIIDNCYPVTAVVQPDDHIVHSGSICDLAKNR